MARFWQFLAFFFCAWTVAAELCTKPAQRKAWYTVLSSTSIKTFVNSLLIQAHFDKYGEARIHQC